MHSKSATGVSHKAAEDSRREALEESSQASHSEKQIQQYNANKKYLNVNGGAKSLADRNVEKLMSEVEQLAGLLDNSEREKQLQQRELNRVKGLLRQYSKKMIDAELPVSANNSIPGIILAQRDAVRDGNAIVTSDTVISIGSKVSLLLG